MNRRNIGWILVLILLIVSAITFLVIQLSKPNIPQIDLADLGPQASVARGISDDGYHTLGNPDARVELVIYEDFGCTACAQFSNSFEESFLEEYVVTGDVYVKIHPVAVISQNISIPALGALYCADSHNYFWEFRHLLFVNQSQGLNQDKYVAFSALLGIDKTNFVDCITSNRFADQIIQQNESAWDLGIKNTPSYVLNGEVFEGLNYSVPEDSDLDSLKQLLDNALNK